jgi:hypothetical protein
VGIQALILDRMLMILLEITQPYHLFKHLLVDFQQIARERVLIKESHLSCHHTHAAITTPLMEAAAVVEEGIIYLLPPHQWLSPLLFYLLQK